MRWFGPTSWGAPVCEPDKRVDIPVGQLCLDCRVRIERTDRGVMIPYARTRSGQYPPTSVQDWKVTLEPHHLACLLASMGLPVDVGARPERRPLTRSLALDLREQNWSIEEIAGSTTASPKRSWPYSAPKQGDRHKFPQAAYTTRCAPLVCARSTNRRRGMSARFKGTGLFAAGAMAALVITGGGAAAYAANGGTVIIGKTNVGTKKTVFSSGKSPVGFVSRTGAPFTVNNSRKVAGLNADRLDGLDSTSFQRAGSKAVDADKLDGLDSSAFLGAGGKAVDADKLDGLSNESFALASGGTADVEANGNWIDVDGDGVSDALISQATCPAGTKLTGGGVENYTLYSTIVSAPATGSWVAISLADFGVDDPTDLVAHAICYNPRGAVAGGTAQGFKASGTTVAELKARAARALSRR